MSIPIATPRTSIILGSEPIALDTHQHQEDTWTSMAPYDSASFGFCCINWSYINDDGLKRVHETFSLCCVPFERTKDPQGAFVCGGSLPTCR